jgi:hypothetical protein
MKIELEYIEVANYSETRYEFQDEIEWTDYQIEQLLKDCTTPSIEQIKFNQGKCDALFLVKPESEDFSYLCGWHCQTEELIQQSEFLGSDCEF